MGLADGLLDRHLDARADGRGRAEDEVVAVAPEEGLAVGGEVLVDGDGEVDPVGGEDQEQSAAGDRQQ